MSGKPARFGLKVNNYRLRVECRSDLLLKHSRETLPVLGGADLLAQFFQDDACVVRIAEKGAIDSPGSALGGFAATPSQQPAEGYPSA
jgi:hypothetical protein